MKQVHLRLRERPRSYTITIQSGLLEDLPALMAKKWRGCALFIVTDENVEKLYGRNLLLRCIDVGLNASLLFFPAGERSKNFKTIHALQTALLENRVRRDSLIIALGGGVVGDVAGFVAATILRGVKYIHVPTTLLAQVDSSIGGKVGIDHPLGKNLIGAFHQPSAVYVDPLVLKTLPAMEFRNGLSEIVKIAAALDGRLFSSLEKNAPSLSRENASQLMKLIYRAVELKAAIVAKDELESGLRSVLNVGHTIGHALEAATSYKLKHGEAVSIGIAIESRLAQRLGLLSHHERTRILATLTALKLPIRVPPLKRMSKFFTVLSADKKSLGSTIRFSMLAGIGRTAIDVRVSTDHIAQLFDNSND
jgi:3-dehydroquinate synthase